MDLNSKCSVELYTYFNTFIYVPVGNLSEK